MLIALLGLTMCRSSIPDSPAGNFFSFYTSNPLVYVAVRSCAGLFDCVLCIAQVYASEISGSIDRAQCLTWLETLSNAAQCFGPLVAALVSLRSVLLAA